MLLVPLRARANQTLTISLGNQNCQVNVYQKNTGLFFDLLVDNAIVICGTICENLNLLVRSKYLGFIGDFCFYDTEGTDDPVYTGLGTRFVLVYLEANNLPTIAGVD